MSKKEFEIIEINVIRSNNNNNNIKLSKKANICFGNFSCAQQEEQKTQMKRGREMNCSEQKEQMLSILKTNLTTTHFTLQIHIDFLGLPFQIHFLVSRWFNSSQLCKKGHEWKKTLIFYTALL